MAACCGRLSVLYSLIKLCIEILTFVLNFKGKFFFKDFILSLNNTD